ncbi:MAG: hypothetical protein QHH12_03435 [Candidatus Bathyarchaeota archaeon]|jgi:ribosome biogenesis protein Nip4|nr:hypothetical protein [Candidatus Bathyarchaeota archaeon A05DMB-3]MDH7606810.1 hypothetical protein [Candidatus Bathyarchaeota archaeon]
MAEAESIEGFARLFGAELSLEKRFVVKMGNRYFLLNWKVKELAGKNRKWRCAGTYLGQIKGGKFHPSFPLLSMIAEKAENKITVDDKAAWLFVCGRDIFKEGILKVEGSTKRGSYTLIFNKHGECLGFGKLTKNLSQIKSGVAVENVLDVGDFLRRERQPVF